MSLRANRNIIGPKRERIEPGKVVDESKFPDWFIADLRQHEAVDEVADEAAPKRGSRAKTTLPIKATVKQAQEAKS